MEECWESGGAVEEAASMALSWMGLAIASATLTYASLLDLRTRLIPDAVWLASYPPAAILLAIQILSGSIQPVEAALSIGVSTLLAAAFYFSGLMGGADAFALILIGVAVPRYPANLPLTWDPTGIPAFSTVCNGTLTIMILPAFNLASNLHEALRGRDPLRGMAVSGRLEKILLYLIARRVSFNTLKRGLHYFPAERLEDGVRKPILFSRAEWDFSSLLEEFELNRSLYEDGVLASPTIPLIASFTLGLILLPLGNIPLLFLL